MKPKNVDWSLGGAVLKIAKMTSGNTKIIFYLAQWGKSLIISQRSFSFVIIIIIIDIFMNKIIFTIVGFSKTLKYCYKFTAKCEHLALWNETLLLYYSIGQVSFQCDAGWWISQLYHSLTERNPTRSGFYPFISD